MITSTVDLLIRTGQQIKCLVVFHTDAGLDPIANSLVRLKAEIDSGVYAGLQVVYEEIVDHLGHPLSDFDDTTGTESFFRMFYRVLWRLKQQNARVHICASGGRKTMSIYAMVAAQLLFDEDDRFWHLFSGGNFLKEKRLHPQLEDLAELIEVPVIHWGLLSPVVSTLRKVEDPYQAIAAIRELQLRQKWSLADQFVQNQLTPAQRSVVALLVREGLSDQQIADRLVLSARTIERHLGDAYQRATDFWGFRERVSRSQLITLLQLYYSTRLGDIPHDTR
ncbi:MAG: hypothetical protein HPY85_07540 [Anaerolineae bacterium]|nr:hypothetical protein [Anaerolineae bacterium]